METVWATTRLSTDTNKRKLPDKTLKTDDKSWLDENFSYDIMIQSADLHKVRRIRERKGSGKCYY